jgi:hypothetical protein
LITMLRRGGRFRWSTWKEGQAPVTNINRIFY